VKKVYLSLQTGQIAFLRACCPVLVVEVTQEHVDRALGIARWYGRRAPTSQLSDLESAALEGLAKAARDWDPERSSEGDPYTGLERSFWNFAFIRILGEMKDELRRLDHLTRTQRAMVTEQESGVLALDDLDWVNPEEPIPLSASIGGDDGEGSQMVLDLLEEPRDPIKEFELRDAFCSAAADLAERARFVVVKRELEGYSNSELADAFDVTEGRASQLRGAALEQMREQIGDAFVDAA
jgi:RNA polymerase sigma factor (sigma-70 family)